MRRRVSPDSAPTYICADWSLPAQEGLPVVIKAGVIHANGDRLSLCSGETPTAEQVRQSIREGELRREQPITSVSCLRVDSRRRVPEQPLVGQPSAKIPHGRNNRS